MLPKYATVTAVSAQIYLEIVYDAHVNVVSG